MTGRPLHAVLLPPGEGGGRMLAALAAALDGTGPAILPLDPALPAGRVEALLAAFAPAALETPGGTRRVTPAGTGRRPSPGAARPGEVPAEVAVVIATSGSTGQPKGVQLTAAAMLHSARASLARIGARPGERWLCPLPVSHIAGLGVLARSLVCGSAPVVTARLGPGGLDPAGCGCAHVSLVPTQLRRLLEARAGVAGFRTILLGGAAAPPGLLAAAKAAGARVVTTYGMSETCGGCVYDGVPLDGVRVRAGPDGRIRIAGPVLFRGYRGQPGLTAATMEEGWFVTSDVGAVAPDGRLAVHGRADEMINTGGEKVSPAMVTAALETHPCVREAAVTGEPDPEWGQRVTAFVVPADPGSPPTLENLRAHVKTTLPAHAAPRALVLLGAIPLLPSGKPDPAALHAEASRLTG